MADTDDEDAPEEPAVELGDGPTVEGAPLSRLTGRLTWPIERSEILERLGDERIRSAEGPIELADALEDVEDTYFGSRQQFESAVREQLPDGPVVTE